jgi:MFS transporter, PPP family, 3-phenylpropionic acid transporter
VTSLVSQKKSVNVLKSFLFFYLATGFVVTSFLPLYLANMGMSPTQIGWILAIGPIASLISEPLGGFLSDKYKSIKKVLLMCVFGMTVSGIILFFVDGFLSIAILSYFLFFFMAPTGALGDSLAQKTANSTGASFGSIRMWGSLGFAISSVVTGYVLQAIGVGNMIIPFVIFAVFTFLSCLNIKDIQVSVKPVQLKDAFYLFKNSRFVLFLVVALLVTIAHRANDVYLSVFINALNGDEAIIGWAWFIGVFTEVFVFSISHLWFRKYHELTFIMIAAFLYGVRFIGMSFASTPLEVMFYQPLHGITFGIFFTAAFSYVTRIVPAELQSTGHVLLVSTFFGYSGIIGSLGGGYLIEHFGVNTLYQALGTSAFVGFIFVFVFKKFVEDKVLKSSASNV